MSYLMLDLSGKKVTEHEQKQLAHSMVGGLILFTRNYENKAQLMALIKEVRKSNPNILIAVDHEGGRVQRFRGEFTDIPAMSKILLAANGDLSQARTWASELGFLMAVELLACDIDLSFAPVLDVNGISEVIGERSFSKKTDEIIELAGAFITGMKQAGMSAVGKHFPGHGSVKADSHIDLPVDNRTKEQIFTYDILPFKQLIADEQIEGIMPAHVIYSNVDDRPAGFSEYWLQTVLRKELNFKGVIFSDDLGMEGASVAGGFKERANAALTAGCDMILVCNNPDAVNTLLTDFQWPSAAPQKPASFLKPDFVNVMKSLENETRWQKAKEIANQINQF
ncbi:beta-N-acetylhexosaminidase [Parashewanella curva]|uniref:Beta-hexosaminidase n=1 Tax=Parashewanella curva TaxID=2338552 RepID=A0A3L8PYX9_9GAMM|nr:beta-N-acetylhexosaminidase [Parashewanella curva]RLV59718.1 beta-N-acetylhexosaminidase [Parashewanella curva]